MTEVMRATDLPEEVRRTMRWLREGNEALDARLAAISDDELGAPTLLPGWTRAHVLTHLARNADALWNLARWAATGIETPMYRNPEKRAADIEEGAGRPPAEVRADYLRRRDRLDDALGQLSEKAWSAEVRTVMGRTVTATAIPWLRVREVWIHGIDLADGSRFADVPADLARALVADVVATFASKPDCPPMLLVGDGPADRWEVGAASAEDGCAVVEGRTGDLLGWLLGREPGDALAKSAPVVPPKWL